MERTHLSDLFKFVHGFGQKGHQIGRKIGDALELIVLGMVHRSPELANHMLIERGIEGATTAKHKVEFAFYKFGANGKPTGLIEDLFGIIECKKVGVEQTIKGSFKKWSAAMKKKNTRFCDSEGYSFAQRVDAVDKGGAVAESEDEDSEEETEEGGVGDRRTIKILPAKTDGNLRICVACRESTTDNLDQTFLAAPGDKFLITIDTNRNFRLLSHEESLADVSANLQSCIVVTVEGVDEETRQVTSLKVEDCLAGPQTPEKAKQSSFVSLDVRKKVLGHFDKDPGRAGFTSVLVIGEASHWEAKSRSMIRLCNDANLIVPDGVVEEFFVQMKETLGDLYQEQMSKSGYATNARIRDVTTAVIEKFKGRVMHDMDTGAYKEFVVLRDEKGKLTLGLVDL